MFKEDDVDIKEIEEIEERTHENATNTAYYEAKTAAYAKGIFELLALMVKGEVKS